MSQITNQPSGDRPVIKGKQRGELVSFRMFKPCEKCIFPVKAVKCKN